MGFSNWVHVSGCNILRETDMAFFVEIPVDDDFEQHWLPKSQLADPDALEVGDIDVTVSMTEYIAREKGIEGDE